MKVESMVSYNLIKITPVNYNLRKDSTRAIANTTPVKSIQIATPTHSNKNGKQMYFYPNTTSAKSAIVDCMSRNNDHPIVSLTLDSRQNVISKNIINSRIS